MMYNGDFCCFRRVYNSLNACETEDTAGSFENILIHSGTVQTINPTIESLVANFIKMKPFKYSICALLGLFLASSLRAELDVDVVGLTVTSGQSRAYWASSSVETLGAVVVNSGGNLSLRAGEMIFLQPGFRVDAGGVFSARISASASYDPGNVYGGTSPWVDWLSPSLLYGAPNTFVGPMTVVVSNSAGSLLTNAPVMLTVESTDGWLATNPQGTGAAKSLYLTTAFDGTVSIYLKTPGTSGTSVKVRVVAGGTSWTLDAYAFAPIIVPDNDNDGLSNGTELALGTDSTAAAATLSTVPGLLVFTP